jgi:hypothetical protein
MPANAGIQATPGLALDSRMRGNDKDGHPRLPLKSAFEPEAGPRFLWPSGERLVPISEIRHFLAKQEKMFYICSHDR